MKTLLITSLVLLGCTGRPERAPPLAEDPSGSGGARGGGAASGDASFADGALPGRGGTGSGLLPVDSTDADVLGDATPYKNGLYLVTNRTHASLDVLDVASLAVVGRVGIGGNPGQVRYDARHDVAIVVHQDHADDADAPPEAQRPEFPRIDFVDVASPSSPAFDPKKSIDLGAGRVGYGMAIAPDIGSEGIVYVAVGVGDSPAEFLTIDLASRAVTSTAIFNRSFSLFHGFLMGYSGGHLYGLDSLTDLDPTTHVPTQTHEFKSTQENWPSAVRFSPDGKGFLVDTVEYSLSSFAKTLDPGDGVIGPLDDPTPDASVPIFCHGFGDSMYESNDKVLIWKNGEVTPACLFRVARSTGARLGYTCWFPEDLHKNHLPTYSSKFIMYDGRDSVAIYDGQWDRDAKLYRSKIWQVSLSRMNPN